MTKLEKEIRTRNIRKEYYKEISLPDMYTVEELDLIVDTALDYVGSINELEYALGAEMEKYYERGVALELDYYGHNPNIRQGVIESHRGKLIESLYILDVEMGAEEVIDKCHKNTNSQWLQDLLKDGNPVKNFTEQDDTRLRENYWILGEG